MAEFDKEIMEKEKRATIKRLRERRLGAFIMASEDVYRKILKLDECKEKKGLKESFEKQLQWFSAIFKNETGLDANVLEFIKEDIENE